LFVCFGYYFFLNNYFWEREAKFKKNKKKKQSINAIKIEIFKISVESRKKTKKNQCKIVEAQGAHFRMNVLRYYNNLVLQCCARLFACLLGKN